MYICIVCKTRYMHVCIKRTCILVKNNSWLASCHTLLLMSLFCQHSLPTLNHFHLHHKVHVHIYVHVYYMFDNFTYMVILLGTSKFATQVCLRSWIQL